LSIKPFVNQAYPSSLIYESKSPNRFCQADTVRSGANIHPQRPNIDCQFTGHIPQFKNVLATALPESKHQRNLAQYWQSIMDAALADSHASNVMTKSY
jgi:hypothetical protein